MEKKRKRRSIKKGIKKGKAIHKERKERERGKWEEEATQRKKKEEGKKERRKRVHKERRSIKEKKEGDP